MLFSKATKFSSISDLLCVAHQLATIGADVETIHPCTEQAEAVVGHLHDEVLRAIAKIIELTTQPLPQSV